MILQNLGDCEGAVSGTGLGSCSNLEIGDLKGIGLLNKNEKSIYSNNWWNRQSWAGPCG
jgi:hypothetical protein